VLTNLRSHWSHGRWTDGGGGGVEAIRTKEQWVKANPNTTLETAVAAARVKQDLMHAAATKIADRLDIKWKNSGIKKNKSGRIDQKAVTRGYMG